MHLISGSDLIIRQAKQDDLSQIKHLADLHRHELGFVLLPSLQEQLKKGEVIVADRVGQVLGFVDYHIRRDKQLTLYHIAVNPTFCRQGIGRALLSGLETIAQKRNCAFILLKCPVDLGANQFYKREGYDLVEMLNGRKRPLNVWKKFLEISRDELDED